MATSSSEITVPTAKARPANCHASRPISATMASVGMLVSMFSTPVRVASMGARRL
ncbi:hypothetical protein D3C71_2119780 [compost metagenome]